MVASTRQAGSATSVDERWQQALRRAIKHGVTVRQIAGSGQWIATSGSRPLAYVTDGVSCECEAAMLGGDPVCQHRAAYRHAMGLLPLADEAAAESSAPETGEHPCPVCAGEGELELRTGDRLDDFWRWKCPTCQGMGMVAPVRTSARLM